MGVLSWFERRREPIVEDRPWDDAALDAALDALRALSGEAMTEHVVGYLRPRRGQVESHVQATKAFADKLTLWLDLLRWRAARTGDDDAGTAADVRALLGEALVARAWEVRTHGVAKTVNQDQWRRFGLLLEEADDVLVGALEARPHHPAAATTRLRVALGLGLKNADRWWERFEVATHDRASLYPAHTQMLTALCRKWHGSDELMFDFARKVAASAPSGDPVSAVLPMAHVEFLLSVEMFENPDGKRAVGAQREADLAGVVEASRRWCGDGSRPMPRHPRDVEAHQLFGWFLSLDGAHGDRARWHLEQAGTRMAFLPWAYLPPGAEWSFRSLRSRLRVAR